MKRLLTVLLLLIIVESAYAEYVTILPVKSQSLTDASSEIVTLSELYGRATTIRYMTDETSQANIALNNTNIYPSDSLTLTEDVLMDNKLFGFYVGAARQVSDQQSIPDPIAAMAMAYTDSEEDYQSLVNKAKAEAGSNIALAKIIEEQINRTSDSELLDLDADLDSDNTLLADDRTSSLIDTLISGGSSDDYDLPLTDNNILISGIGGAILSGGGSGGDGGFALADGSGNVPEPSTWGLLVLGVAGLAYYRKRFAR